MINAIQHTAVSTGDLDRLVKFYSGLLGFEVEFETKWDSGFDALDKVLGLKDTAGKLAMLRLGDFRLELFQFSSPEPKRNDASRPVCDHGLTHLAFTVDDVETEYERLVSAGMVFHCPPQNMGSVKVTYGRDPDGNVVELMEEGES